MSGGDGLGLTLDISASLARGWRAGGITSVFVSPRSPSQKLLQTGGRSSICGDKSACIPPAHPQDTG